MANVTVETIGYVGKPVNRTGDLLGGLLLHKNGRSWVITHVASGCGLGPGNTLKKDALVRRARLLELLDDWSEKDLCDLAMRAGYVCKVEFAREIRRVAY